MNKWQEDLLMLACIVVFPFIAAGFAIAWFRLTVLMAHVYYGTRYYWRALKKAHEQLKD